MLVANVGVFEGEKFEMLAFGHIHPYWYEIKHA